jgi:hypothetical protein
VLDDFSSLGGGREPYTYIVQCVLVAVKKFLIKALHLCLCEVGCFCYTGDACVTFNCKLLTVIFVSLIPKQPHCHRFLM